MYEKVNQFKNDSYFVVTNVRENFCLKNIIFNIRQKKKKKKKLIIVK